MIQLRHWMTHLQSFFCDRRPNSDQNKKNSKKKRKRNNKTIWDILEILFKFMVKNKRSVKNVILSRRRRIDVNISHYYIPTRRNSQTYMPYNAAPLCRSRLTGVFFFSKYQTINYYVVVHIIALKIANGNNVRPSHFPQTSEPRPISSWLAE